MLKFRDLENVVFSKEDNFTISRIGKCTTTKNRLRDEEMAKSILQKNKKNKKTKEHGKCFFISISNV